MTRPKSFINRHIRGNLNFDNCKFVAIDEVDDIFEQDKANLGEILKIIHNNKLNLGACSTTTKK